MISSPYAKAFAAALAVLILWVVNGLTTGDWSDVSALHPALTTVILGVVVYFVPNDRTP